MGEKNRLMKVAGKRRRAKEQKEAREWVLKTLTEKRPLGGSQGWEDMHQERTSADIDREKRSSKPIL